MSPGIGISVPVAKLTPRLAIMSAVAEARAKGIPLTFGRLGVLRGHLSGQWAVDRKSAVRGLSVVGCLLLSLQPESTDDEEPTAIAARAVGVTLSFLEGVADGWDFVTMNRFWADSATHGPHYTNGFEVGAEVRFMATVVCRQCNSRRFKTEEVCPGCDAR